MTLPTEFVQIPKAISNYDFTDLASGTAYQLFYMADTASGSYLVDNAIYSSPVDTSDTSTATTGWRKLTDKTFEVTFKKPQDIKGDLITSMPIYMLPGGGDTSQGRFITTIKKDSGGSITDIMSGTSAILNSAAGTEKQGAISQTFTISSLTHFAIDDKLKIRSEGWGNTGGSNTVKIGHAHDPKNRASDPFDTSAITWTIDTISQALVPFRIDI